MSERLIVDAFGTEKIIPPQEKILFESKKPQVIDEEEILRHLMEARRLHQSMEVGQREAKVELKPQYPNLPAFIWFNCDDHMGGIGVDYEALIRDYNIVQNTPNFFCLSNGDEVDNFQVNGGSATGVYEDPITPEQQAILLQRMWGKLDGQNKLVAMSFGNHNAWTYKGGYTFEGTWLRDFKCPILNCGGMVTVKCGEVEYKIAMTHNYWGQSKLNPTNVCKRFMEHEYPEADILFLAHSHQSEALWFRRDASVDYRWAIVGGTYKIDDVWAAQMGIGGRGKPGGLCLSLNPNHRDIQFYDSLTKAQSVLELLVDINRLKYIEDPYS